MSNNEEIEYNLRQFELIEYFINSYKRSLVNLGTVVDKIDSLINVLKNISPKDYNELWGNWFILEEVYSVMLYGNKKEEDLSLDDDLLIKEGLEKIENKIKEMKASHLELTDREEKVE